MTLTRRTVRCLHGFAAHLCTVPSCGHFAAEPFWIRNKRELDRNRQRNSKARRAAKQERQR